MQKITITVPRGIRYIGDWSDFQLSNFPAKCIINKVIPGCGFTRYCIERQFENVILCSPRKMLLQNKYDQHKTQAYLVVNDLDQDPGIDIDVRKDKKSVETDEEKKDLNKPQNPTESDEQRITQVKSRLHTELRQYMSGHLQWKILVTYDSFRILKEVLEEMGIFSRFYVVIDEMQAIMQDSRFKSSTEVSFLYHLQNSHSAIFVSATPMLEEYLDELPEFKDLPYYELDWRTEDFTRIVKPDLEVRRMTSISVEAKNILDRFKSKQYDSVTVIENGQPVIKEATELVFYVNSVTAIIGIIKSNDLSDDQVNILCSNTSDNQRKIWSRLGGKTKGFDIGHVPIKGEPRKPITLCTRTVYLGADFYSDCAKSYIFSDSNSDYLSVDISQDLPQILGRQRCDENPWKNSATLFYRTTEKKLSKEDFDKKIEKKKKATDGLLRIWRNTESEEDKLVLANNYSKVIRMDHYKDDYVAVNIIKIKNPETGETVITKIPVENYLVRVAEKRAFDIQQIDYADRFSVFTTLSNQFSDGFDCQSNELDPIEFQVTKFFEVYEGLKNISDRLKLLCEIPVSQTTREIILAQLPDTDKVRYLYTAAGPERCKANSYAPKKISKELGIKFFSRADIAKAVYTRFNEGQKITLIDAKAILSEIYGDIGYDKTPKAVDLKNFFDLKDCMITDPSTKKRTKAYHLIKKLL